ncbi:MAG: mecA [Bacillales bacterium]|jgi:adapter protein MecA 1/2|nr:mecA [Bacillales bacterium]
MDIERIDDNTVKFFITVQDIEKRGFSFEELWSDRQIGEKFMWELLEEVQEMEDIQFEHGIKVQVNITMNGLEFIVSNRFENNEPLSFMHYTGKDGKPAGKPIPIKSLLENLIKHSEEVDNEEKTVVDTPSVYAFESFEDVIGLFKNAAMDFKSSKLFSYENRYYLSIDLDLDDIDMDKKTAIGLFLEEYAKVSSISNHFLNDYGKEIIPENVYSTINQYFK